MREKAIARPSKNKTWPYGQVRIRENEQLPSLKYSPGDRASPHSQAIAPRHNNPLHHLRQEGIDLL